VNLITALALDPTGNLYLAGNRIDAGSAIVMLNSRDFRADL
jgi:hypothetical protein